MAKVLVTESHLEDIADSIRAKNGTGNVYKPSEMAAAINALVTAEDLGTKSITANGTYSASDDDLDGYSEVTVNVSGGASTLVPKTITANGTYDPTDDNADGYSSVTVNVSGGGVTLLTQAQWDALTTAQKQAYGLVAIQRANSGYERGILVNGADYLPIGVYLPYSTFDNVICEAYPSLYDNSLSYWGYGDNPIIIGGTAPTVESDGSIGIYTKTNGTLAYVDLGATGTTFTAYFVGKVITANGSYTRLLAAMASRNSGQGIMLYGYNTVKVSSWASDTSTGISSADYFVGMIQYNGGGSANGTAISSDTTPTYTSKTPSTAGRYLTIGRTDINSSTSNAEPTDMAVLYLGVVNEYESESVVTANMQYLVNQFLA